LPEALLPSLPEALAAISGAGPNPEMVAVAAAASCADIRRRRRNCGQLGPTLITYIECGIEAEAEVTESESRER